MPIYEYYCTDCGHEFEIIQKITADPISQCEKCEANSAKRAISRTSFVLKGSGWYVTDYGGKSSAPPKEKSSDSSSDAPSGA